MFMPGQRRSSHEYLDVRRVSTASSDGHLSTDSLQSLGESRSLSNAPAFLQPTRKLDAKIDKYRLTAKSKVRAFIHKAPQKSLWKDCQEKIEARRILEELAAKERNKPVIIKGRKLADVTKDHEYMRLSLAVTDMELVKRFRDLELQRPAKVKKKPEGKKLKRKKSKKQIMEEREKARSSAKERARARARERERRRNGEEPLSPASSASSRSGGEEDMFMLLRSMTPRALSEHIQNWDKQPVTEAMDVDLEWSLVPVKGKGVAPSPIAKSEDLGAPVTFPDDTGTPPPTGAAMSPFKMTSPRSDVDVAPKTMRFVGLSEAGDLGMSPREQIRSREDVVKNFVKGSKRLRDDALAGVDLPSDDEDRMDKMDELFHKETAKLIKQSKKRKEKSKREREAEARHRAKKMPLLAAVKLACGVDEKTGEAVVSKEGDIVPFENAPTSPLAVSAVPSSPTRQTPEQSSAQQEPPPPAKEMTKELRVELHNTIVDSMHEVHKREREEMMKTYEATRPVTQEKFILPGTTTDEAGIRTLPEIKLPTVKKVIGDSSYAHAPKYRGTPDIVREHEGRSPGRATEGQHAEQENGEGVPPLTSMSAVKAMKVEQMSSPGRSPGRSVTNTSSPMRSPRGKQGSKTPREDGAKTQVKMLGGVRRSSMSKSGGALLMSRGKQLSSIGESRRKMSGDENSLLLKSAESLLTKHHVSVNATDHEGPSERVPQLPCDACERVTTLSTSYPVCGHKACSQCSTEKECPVCGGKGDKVVFSLGDLDLPVPAKYTRTQSSGSNYSEGPAQMQRSLSALHRRADEHRKLVAMVKANFNDNFLIIGENSVNVDVEAVEDFLSIHRTEDKKAQIVECLKLIGSMNKTERARYLSNSNAINMILEVVNMFREDTKVMKAACLALRAVNHPQYHRTNFPTTGKKFNGYVLPNDRSKANKNAVVLFAYEVPKTEGSDSISESVHSIRAIHRPSLERYPPATEFMSKTSEALFDVSNQSRTLKNALLNDTRVLAVSHKPRVVYDSTEPSPYMTRHAMNDLKNGKVSRYYHFQTLEDLTLLFESRFEGGNLKRALQKNLYEYDLILEADTNSYGHQQWFYFSVSNASPSSMYRFNILNFHKKSSLFNRGMMPLVFSVNEARTNGTGWKRVGEDIIYYKNAFPRPSKPKGGQQSFNRFHRKYHHTLSWTMNFSDKKDTYYIAFSYPYTYSDLQHYLSMTMKAPHVSIHAKRETLCLDLCQNRCEMITVTSPSSVQNPVSSRKVIVATARLHPGENVGSYMIEGFISFITGMSAEAGSLRDQCVFYVFPMMNPDGVIMGNSRCGLGGIDMNRSFQNTNAAVTPTVSALKRFIEGLQSQGCNLHTYLDFHGHSVKKGIFFYGIKRPKWDDSRNPIRLSEQLALPRAVSNQSPGLFSFHNCRFNCPKSKLSTARIVMWQAFGFRRSYTVEASFCGPPSAQGARQQYNVSHYRMSGSEIARVLADEEGQAEEPEAVYPEDMFEDSDGSDSDPDGDNLEDESLIAIHQMIHERMEAVKKRFRRRSTGVLLSNSQGRVGSRQGDADGMAAGDAPKKQRRQTTAVNRRGSAMDPAVRESTSPGPGGSPFANRPGSRSLSRSPSPGRNRAAYMISKKTLLPLEEYDVVTHLSPKLVKSMRHRVNRGIDKVRLQLEGDL